MGSDEGLEGFFRVGGRRTGLFMLALVSRVRNCPEGVHSSARARLKVCEPSGQSPEPQWPYTGSVAEVRRAGRSGWTLPQSRPSRSRRPTSSSSITLAASCRTTRRSTGPVYDGLLPPTLRPRDSRCIIMPEEGWMRRLFSCFIAISHHHMTWPGEKTKDKDQKNASHASIEWMDKWQTKSLLDILPCCKLLILPACGPSMELLVPFQYTLQREFLFLNK